jgi:hypothetical protein
MKPIEEMIEENNKAYIEQAIIGEIRKNYNGEIIWGRDLNTY